MRPFINYCTRNVIGQSLWIYKQTLVNPSSFNITIMAKYLTSSSPTLMYYCHARHLHNYATRISCDRACVLLHSCEYARIGEKKPIMNRVVRRKIRSFS